MQARESNQVVTLPPMGPQLSAEQVNQKSLTHWVIMLGKNISNMMPWGLKSELGYRDKRWDVFERCVPYPLSNLTSTAVDRAAMGEIHQSGFTLSAQSVITKELVKYAQEQAQELGESYATEGLRVLTPLTGIDDPSVVQRIIQVVQPYAYQMHEMAHEFTEGARQRIADSKLSAEEKAIAFDVAKILLNGSQAAVASANRQYEELITMMSDAQVGKPGISNPTEYHRWLCGQLGKEVPERVNRMQGNNDSKAINILAQRALREESAADMMMEELKAEREARRVLEERLAKLESEKTAKAK